MDSGKTCKGGMAILVKQSCCINWKTFCELCSENVKAILPAQRTLMNHCTHCVVYTPPSPKTRRRQHQRSYIIWSDSINTYILMSLLLFWEFLNCNPCGENMTKLYQFVIFPTRGNKTLDSLQQLHQKCFFSWPQTTFWKDWPPGNLA